jgi:hypothetical protein
MRAAARGERQAGQHDAAVQVNQAFGLWARASSSNICSEEVTTDAEAGEVWLGEVTALEEVRTHLRRRRAEAEANRDGTAAAAGGRVVAGRTG